MLLSSFAELKTAQTGFGSIADLLPHAPPMVLVDEVVDWSENSVSVAVFVRPEIPFFVVDKGVPVHVGIEYMAQACGVYAGIEARHHNHPIRFGYLLGTRNYSSNTDWFHPGSKLLVNARLIMRQEQMGVFDCQIINGGKEIASAQLSVYQPEATLEVSDNSSKG